MTPVMTPTALPFPESVIIEPTDACNLRCSYCPRRLTSGKKVGYMDTSLFCSIVNEAVKRGARELVLFHRGESLLHPDIGSMLRYAARGHGSEGHSPGRRPRVVLATNGLLLKGGLVDTVLETVDFLSVSMHGEVNGGVGGQDRIPEHNLNQLRLVQRYGTWRSRRIEIQVSMVRVAETTQDKVDGFIAKWQGRVNRVRVYEEHSRNGKFGSVGGRRVGPRTPCMKVFRQTAVSWDGLVGRCNHDWDGDPLGNASGDGGVAAVWNGDTYKRLREQHVAGGITDAICEACESWYGGTEEAGTGVLVKGERS